jgi:hypothetical protein
LINEGPQIALLNQPPDQPDLITFQLNFGGHFAAENGGHFAAKSGGQFDTKIGGHITRNLHRLLNVS